MARTVRDAKLESRAARARLAVQPKPHWRTLVPGQLHLGYRRRRKDAPGTWVVRRYLGLDAGGVGRYAADTLGLADDYQDANGESVLAFAQAQARAHETVRAAKAADTPGPLIPSPIDQNLSAQSRRPSESHPSRSRIPRHESTKPGSGIAVAAAVEDYLKFLRAERRSVSSTTTTATSTGARRTSAG
jgi:hypothetical protein